MPYLTVCVLPINIGCNIVSKKFTQLFGLDSLLRLPCPKPKLLQTQEGIITAALSEVEVSSDTWRHYYSSPVRSRSYFRHKKALLRLPCPKSKLLQTHDGIITAALSEVEATSDTSRHYYGCPVRSRSYYRHKEAIFLLPCPKSKLLQT
jgi:hypothetical protein